MNRPWQIWTIYMLCLLPLLAGLAWLSVRVLRLDEAEAAARRRQEETALQSEFEADVRLALRRIDLALAELLAREAAWPHYAFRSYFRPPEAPDAAPVPSPLLEREADYVKLYFQVDPSGAISSPQLPSTLPPTVKRAQHEIESTRIAEAQARLQELEQMVDRQVLLARIPVESVSSEVMLALNDTWSAANQPMLPDPFAPDQLAQAPSANLPNDVEQQVESRDVTNARPPTVNEAPNPGSQAFAPQQSAYQGQSLDQDYRNETDYQSRKRRIESYNSAFQQHVKNREWLSQGKVVAGLNAEPIDISDVAGLSAAIEGISRPIWIANELMLLRRVVADGETTIQGVWLDWPAIREVLQQEVRELFPDLSMLPVSDEANGDPARMLASAPVLLNVRQPQLPAAVAATASATAIALFVAWACLAVAALAGAVMLAGVVSLSERRATFVSAVTHELRTPLTTFRMYAEMLAEGMVRDESQRKTYLETLRTEADRLYHLVENVLAYARLERGAAAANRSEVVVDELVSRCSSRLAARAAEAGMKLCIEIPADCAEVRIVTDVAAVEQILFNLIDNACKYARDAQDRRIHVDVSSTRSEVRLQVADHGPGIAQREAAKLFRPFTKSARDAANSAPGVGLGLALCRRLARDLGGDLHANLSASDAADHGAQFVLTLTR